MKAIRVLLILFSSSFSGFVLSDQGITLPLFSSITLPASSNQVRLELSKNNFLLSYDSKQGKFSNEIVDIVVARSTTSFNNYSIEVAQNSSICENGKDVSVSTVIDGTTLVDNSKIESQFKAGTMESTHLLVLQFSELDRDTDPFSCEGYVTLMVTIL